MAHVGDCSLLLPCGFQERTQAVRTGSKCLYPISHLIGPLMIFLSEYSFETSNISTLENDLLIKHYFQLFIKEFLIPSSEDLNSTKPIKH